MLLIELTSDTSEHPEWEDPHHDDLQPDIWRGSKANWLLYGEHAHRRWKWTKFMRISLLTIHHNIIDDMYMKKITSDSACPEIKIARSEAKNTKERMLEGMRTLKRYKPYVFARLKRDKKCVRV